MIAYEQIPAKCTWLATIAMLKIDVAIQNGESKAKVAPPKCLFLLSLKLKDRYILIEQSVLHQVFVFTNSYSYVTNSRSV